MAMDEMSLLKMTIGNWSISEGAKDESGKAMPQSMACVCEHVVMIFGQIFNTIFEMGHSKMYILNACFSDFRFET